jgi:outer membrane protein assembly factor BamB
MDPGQQKPDRNRGVALWGNLVISVTGLDGRVIGTDKETGKIVWDTNLLDQEGMEITAAPLALKDEVIIGGSGGDNGVRCWLASLDAKTGKLKWKTFAVPAPGEAGSETWKDKANAWRRVLCDGLVRSCDQPDLLGLWQSRAALRFRLPARRQPLHQQHDRVRRRDRQDRMVFPAHGE